MSKKVITIESSSLLVLPADITFWKLGEVLVSKESLFQAPKSLNFIIDSRRQGDVINLIRENYSGSSYFDKWK